MCAAGCGDHLDGMLGCGWGRCGSSMLQCNCVSVSSVLHLAVLPPCMQAGLLL